MLLFRTIFVFVPHPTSLGNNRGCLGKCKSETTPQQANRRNDTLQSKMQQEEQHTPSLENEIYYTFTIAHTIAQNTSLRTWVQGREKRPSRQKIKIVYRLF